MERRQVKEAGFVGMGQTRESINEANSAALLAGSRKVSGPKLGAGPRRCHQWPTIQKGSR